MTGFTSDYWNKDKKQIMLDDLSKFTGNHHNSYLDKLLDILFETAVNIVWANMLLSILK